MSDQHPASEDAIKTPEMLHSEDPNDAPGDSEEDLDNLVFATFASRAVSSETANKTAVKEIAAMVPKMLPKPPAVFTKALLNTYKASPEANNLYSNNKTVHRHVVEVRAIFDYERESKPPVKQKIVIVLDIDIPPPPSTQGPHFGWEIHLAGKKSVGHVPVDPTGLTGRPKRGDPSVQTAAGRNGKDKLTKNETMTWKFESDWIK
ncbi:hypothetical protein Q9L58_010464 [Maublancomyces gigas]|uniref:Uncharacterized protein n=1 Tax=Discina gigas TaxID=1032678 RepID=A0ABR3G4M4_9PEZI